MVDSTMSKMQKGKRPSEMSEARFKEKTLKPKVRPGDTGRYKAPMLTSKQKTLPEGLKKKIIEAKKSGAGYSGSSS